MIRLLFGDCLKRMKQIPDGSIDMVLTSPPYDNLRDYDNMIWNDKIWKLCIVSIARLLKEGGVCVWIVNDATIEGSETGTAFRQALYFMDQGLKLNDTMIWMKPGFTATGALPYRYAQVFEYMFVFTKGHAGTFNPIKDRRAKPSVISGDLRQKDGTMKKKSNQGRAIAPDGYAQRFNVWYMNTENNNTLKHPAVFPLRLACDHIMSWSNKGDVILDPFMGSGTTGVACKLLDRSFIGIEISKEYFKIAKKRIESTRKQKTLLDEEELRCVKV